MKKIVFIIMVCLTYSYADLRDFAKSMVLHEDKAGTIKTEDRTILYGGGYSYRAPNVTLTPFNVKAPSMKAGCNGIDLAFGSISFLDKDQFVKFAEGILAAAPGVAFDLALKTLCPSCSETLKALEALANEINNMSLDSCAAATALVNGAFEKAGGEQLKSELGDNKVNSWLSGATKHIEAGTKWMSGFNSMLGGLGNAKQSPVLLQLLKEGQNGPSNNKDTLVNLLATKHELGIDTDIMRSIFGDLVLGAKATNENPMVLIALSPLSNIKITTIENGVKNDLGSNYSKMIDYILNGSSDGLNIYKKISHGNYTSQVLSKDADNTSLEKDFKTRIDEIIKKMEERTQLSSEDIQFVGMFQMPIYKIFNALSSPQTISILHENSENLAKMLSVQILYEYTQKWIAALSQEIQAVDRYKKEIEKVPTDFGFERMGEFLGLMITSAREFNNELFSRYASEQKNFFDNLRYTETMKQTQEMKNLVMLRVNPDILKNLEYAKTMYK